jgi:hypothetical protein
MKMGTGAIFVDTLAILIGDRRASFAGRKIAPVPNFLE